MDINFNLKKKWVCHSGSDAAELMALFRAYGLDNPGILIYNFDIPEYQFGRKCELTTMTTPSTVLNVLLDHCQHDFVS